MPWLKKRDRRPEVMDQPGLCPQRHSHALNALARINFLSATARSFFGHLVELQAQLEKRTLRILDVASGGGDVAVRLWQRADRLELDWRIAGCDVSPVAVDHAHALALRNEAPVHFFVHDVLAGPVIGSYDAVICSLFLHHLDDSQAISLLRAVAGLGDEGPKAILVNDLDRSLSGLALAYVVPRVMTRSDVVHSDATMSVRAAFTPAEALRVAEEAGLRGARIRRCWPCRWLLTWRRP